MSSIRATEVLTKDTCCAEHTGINISFNTCAAEIFNKCLAEFEDLEQLNVVLEVKAGSLDRLNDACSRFQGNEECCHSGMGMILMSARLRMHICSQVLDLNVFFL